MARGQHINTFEKGMTSDVNIMYQPNGTYRYMKNCSLIDQEGNNFTIKDCLGNTLIFTLNIPYYDYDVTTPGVATFEGYPMAISFISFPSKLVVIHTNITNSTGGYGEIGVLNYSNYGQGIQPIVVTNNVNNGYTPIYGHKDLKLSQMYRIEGFAYEETDDIQRIYWTDNFNEPRVLNVADSIFSTYIATGSLVVGEQYMVLEGIIRHNGVNYAPTNGTQASVLTNVFTAANANYTDLTVGATAKVIAYYPIQLLNFTPSRSVGNIKFKNLGAGSVYCGTKIYFYRLSKPSDGIYTSWSYGSSPIQVGTENSVTASPANPFFDFTGGGTSNTLVNSGRSVTITIDNIDTVFDNIEVAVAEFDQSLEVIRIIQIIANETITGTSMDITQSSSVGLGELTLSDITLFPASILKCKTLTTNKNYILIGNIQERTEFENFDTSNVVFSQIQHKIRAHQGEYGAAGSAQVCENVLSYNMLPSVSNVSPSTAANPALVNGIQPYTEWIVTTGVATYNGTAYGPAQTAGQFFRGVPAVYNWANTSGTAIVRPAVYRNKYTTQGGILRPDGIQFNAADTYQWNYKNAAVAAWKKGYWSSQTYRFGILFFDLKGNPFYVRWLDDFTFDDPISTPLMELIQVNSGGDDDWYLNQNGISIDGIEIPSTLIDLISGFSIVRAERDATIMTQGMLMQVAYNAPASVNWPSPNGVDSAYTNDNGQLFTYICPDKLVDYPVNSYATGSRVSISHWVIPRTFAGANLKASSDGGDALETKYLEIAAAEGTPDPNPDFTITGIQDVTEGQTVTGFGVGNWDFYNNQAFGPIAAPAIDAACSAPVAVANKTSVGGPRTLIEIEGALYGYNQYPVTGYGDVLASDPNKLMANITVSKTSLYNGQSPQALANTFYISIGHFQPITAAVKTDTFNGVNKYIFNGVHVWGGDCYNCLITYGHSLADVTGVAPPFTPGAFQTTSWGIKFACQCNSNYDLRRGREVEAVRMYPALTGVVYNNGTTSLLEGFSYNKGYSSTGLAFLYPALPTVFSNTGQFRFRIRFAGQKAPAQTTDVYRTFLVTDFKDTDGQGGEINNLKTKDGRTIVWQNKIVNTVPILERQQIVSTNSDVVNIGTGGVVDRFDPITSDYGNQHQWSVTESEYGFFWFDMRKKAFMVLDFGSGVQEVSQIEGLKAFFDEVFLEVTGTLSATTNVVNSQTFDATSDRPLLGVGITGTYDPKFKTSYLTFKFYQRENDRGVVENINKDFTIGYYHPAKAFLGFFDWTPAIAHNHNQWVMSSKNPQMKTKYYGAGMASTDFAVGDIVSYLNSEYICIAAVTIASYPGTAPQIPNAAASAFWYKINQTNQIWVHNQPINYSSNPAPDFEYSKFFGQVVDGEVIFIVNPDTENQFSVLNMEQHGNNENVSDVYTETQYDSASETSITSTNRYYRWIYVAICSALPLTSIGKRLTDTYLQIRLYKKNWTSVPYTRTRNPKILEMIKSIFEEKR